MKLGAIVIDSNRADELADFYASLLGWTKHRYDDEWVFIKSDNGEGLPIVFQQVDHYERPVWPAEPGKQQHMAHLDFYTDHVADSVEHALKCGAILAETQFDDGWRVMIDPAGHPFCIIPNTPPEK